MTPDDKTKVLTKLNSLQGEAKWKYAQKMLHNLNASARFEHLETVKEATIKRNDQLNLMGASKAGHMRHGLCIPNSLLVTIQLVDPQFYHLMTKGSATEQKSSMRKLMRAFPEYSIARSI